MESLNNGRKLVATLYSSLFVLVFVTTGCSSFKAKDRRSNSGVQNSPVPVGMPFDEDASNSEGSGVDKPANLPNLDIVVLDALDARDRNHLGNYKSSFGSFDCFGNNDIAIRFPKQFINRKEVIDWDLYCRSNSSSSYKHCSDLDLGRQKPDEIGIDDQNSSVTYIFKDLPDGSYTFTAYASGTLDNPMSIEQTKSFEVCSMSNN